LAKPTGDIELPGRDTVELPDLGRRKVIGVVAGIMRPEDLCYGAQNRFYL
jgi:hypothetical protein